TCVAAAGHAIVHSRPVSPRERDQLLYQPAWNYVGVVHGAYHEAVPENGIGEAGGFERRIGADEGIYGKDEVGSLALSGQSLGRRGRAFQPQLLAGGPEKGDVATAEVGPQSPGCGHQGGATDTVVKGAGGRPLS